MLLQAFSDTPNWIIYNIYKNTLKNAMQTLWTYPVSSAVIFSNTIEYITSSSCIDSSKFFIWVFSHFIGGLLVGASNAIGCSCNRQSTFNINDDNLE